MITAHMISYPPDVFLLNRCTDRISFKHICAITKGRFFKLSF